MQRGAGSSGAGSSGAGSSGAGSSGAGSSGDGSTDFNYSWSQTEEEVVIEGTVPGGTKSTDVDLQLTSKSIQLKVHGDTVLDGQLFSQIVPDACYFEVESRANSSRQSTVRILTVTLEKHTASTWQCFIPAGESVRSLTFDDAYQAALKGNAAVVRPWLEAGRPMVERKQGSAVAPSLLIAACSRSSDANDNMVRMLLQHQADVNHDKGDGGTALTRAAGSENENAVHMLIQAGAHLDQQRFPAGTSALMASASCGHAGIVAALLNARATVDLLDEMGGTALSIASQAGNDEVVRLLVSANADVNLQASKQGFLMAGGPYMSTDETVRRLATRYAMLGVSPLMAAAKFGNVSTARILLEQQASVNHEAPTYGSALMFAVRGWQRQGSSMLPMVKLLLEAKASANITRDGSTPAQFLMDNSGEEAVIRLLVANEGNSRETEADHLIRPASQARPRWCCLGAGQSLRSFGYAGDECRPVWPEQRAWR